MKTQPEALHLANLIDKVPYRGTHEAADCLRRLHEVNQELLNALQEIATAFVPETAPEAYLMQTARKAIAKATGESK